MVTMSFQGLNLTLHQVFSQKIHRFQQKTSMIVDPWRPEVSQPINHLAKDLNNIKVGSAWRIIPVDGYVVFLGPW